MVPICHQSAIFSGMEFTHLDHIPELPFLPFFDLVKNKLSLLPNPGILLSPLCHNYLCTT